MQLHQGQVAILRVDMENKDRDVAGLGNAADDAAFVVTIAVVVDFAVAVLVVHIGDADDGVGFDLNGADSDFD
ncbi:MAG: hypothetical protein J0626_08110, partial [Rhodospirillaceae bacterium]|nr:hypothetical protein [Rhodospirillaceae bacterium]